MVNLGLASSFSFCPAASGREGKWEEMTTIPFPNFGDLKKNPPPPKKPNTELVKTLLQNQDNENLKSRPKTAMNFFEAWTSRVSNAARQTSWQDCSHGGAGRGSTPLGIFSTHPKAWGEGGLLAGIAHPLARLSASWWAPYPSRSFRGEEESCWLGSRMPKTLPSGGCPSTTKNPGYGAASWKPTYFVALFFRETLFGGGRAIDPIK